MKRRRAEEELDRFFLALSLDMMCIFAGLRRLTSKRLNSAWERVLQTN